jgi:hypothetical protein
MRVALRDISEAAAFDPKKALLDKIGSDLDQVEVFHNLVLVATYIAPPRIMKGPNGEDVVFHRTDRAHEEDRFQGKCALVLKCGPLAFKDDSVAKFGGVTVEPGDWIYLNPVADGRELFLGGEQAKEGVSCRLVEDTKIKGRVAHPSMIY